MHSAPKIEAISAPKMEAQRWRLNVQILSKIRKFNPDENKIWTHKLKGPQLTQKFQRPKSPHKFVRRSPQVKKTPGEGSEMILPFNFKRNNRLGHKKTKLEPCSLGTS